jgi:hypothetical protein
LADWVCAGQSPAEFWAQTPASFDAVLNGAIKARKLQNDADLAMAYNIAAFNSAGRVGKLKSLAHYQAKARSSGVARKPQEMLNVFREFQARGAPMTIRHVARKPE